MPKLPEEKAHELIALAWAAADRSYSPYSGFRVGAALLAKSGKIYQGCNIENSAFSPTNCAERTAFFKAVYEQESQFIAIAIVGEHADSTRKKPDFTPPCGVCRQVMLEFCSLAEFQIILGNRTREYQSFSLEELIPHSFTKF